MGTHNYVLSRNMKNIRVFLSENFQFLEVKFSIGTAVFSSGPFTRYMVGSIGVTWRSNIAKIIPIGIPRWPPWPPSWKSIFSFFSWAERPPAMAAILKICFSLLLLNRRTNWLKTWSEVFFTSPELKGQLTQNLVGSVRVTCRSKIAKIVLIGNPRWLPWQPSWKSVFHFFS